MKPAYFLVYDDFSEPFVFFHRENLIEYINAFYSHESEFKVYVVDKWKNHEIPVLIETQTTVAYKLDDGVSDDS